MVPGDDKWRRNMEYLTILVIILFLCGKVQKENKKPSLS